MRWSSSKYVLCCCVEVSSWLMDWLKNLYKGIFCQHERIVALLVCCIQFLTAFVTHFSDDVDKKGILRIQNFNLFAWLTSLGAHLILCLSGGTLCMQIVIHLPWCEQKSCSWKHTQDLYCEDHRLNYSIDNYFLDIIFERAVTKTNSEYVRIMSVFQSFFILICQIGIINCSSDMINS